MMDEPQISFGAWPLNIRGAGLCIMQAKKSLAGPGRSLYLQCERIRNNFKRNWLLRVYSGENLVSQNSNKVKIIAYVVSHYPYMKFFF